MYLRKIIKESLDDFDWIRDSDPIEVINLNDEWHVSTIKEGDKLEITGKADGIEFYNEPCEVVCVGSCSEHPYSSSVKWNAWGSQTLVSFEREFYSEEMDETTHCGPNNTAKKCNCREVYIGTCWWIAIPNMEEVVRINVGEMNESKGDWDFVDTETPLHGVKFTIKYGPLIDGNVYTIEDYNDPRYVTVSWVDENGTFSTNYRRHIVDSLFSDGTWALYDDNDQLNESKDDFDWVRGEVTFDINTILDKRMYYRFNNLDQLEEKYNNSPFDYNRGDIELGDIRWDNGWSITEIDGEKCTLTLGGGGDTTYDVDEVEQYVNLGIWVLLDENGNVLNDFENKNITESEYYLNKVVSKLSLLKEDGKTEPDMEWDFTEIKQDIDKSKQWVKTAEDVKQYLKLLIQKIKDLPRETKVKILKYVFMSFIGLVGFKTLNVITKEVSPEKIEISLSQETKQEPIKTVKIRKSSDELFNHLKWEEGSIREKGKPVLTAYDLGDGAYTIGYGHAVFKDPSRGDNGGKYDFLPKYNKIIPGKTKITPKQAEILLMDDIKIAEDGLNRILNDWSKKGINPEINQSMYDAMVSMIFNMGIQNFRTSEFIQMVKRGDIEAASQEIKNISSHMFNKYPGLKTRREKESELFTS